MATMASMILGELPLTQRLLQLKVDISFFLRMMRLCVAADPFSPAPSAAGVSEPSDLMAAFGGGAPANNGAAQASPWDLGGLDPVPLMGQVSNISILRINIQVH